MSSTNETSTKKASTRKTWLITGCTSGLGRAIAETTLAAGYNVVATALQESDVADLVERFPGTCRIAALDVTKAGDVAAAVALANEAFGGVDVLVNNAGFGFMGAIEESAPDEYRPMFEVNLFGTINMIQAVLPGMRERRRGHIINISSVGGFAASAAFGLYAAAKFGVEGVSESLAIEVAPFGIKVTIIEPGSFRTNFRGSSMNRAKIVIPDYADTTGRTRNFIDTTHGTQAGDPHKAARAMIAIVESETPPLRLPLGADAYARVRGKLAAVARDLEGWEKVGMDTTFEGMTATSRV